jgi:hypothetical protein
MIATRHATAGLAESVREYIVSLQTEPEREFRYAGTARG